MKVIPPRIRELEEEVAGGSREKVMGTVVTSAAAVEEHQLLQADSRESRCRDCRRAADQADVSPRPGRGQPVRDPGPPRRSDKVRINAREQPCVFCYMASEGTACPREGKGSQ